MENLTNIQKELIFNFFNTLNTEICINDYVDIENVDFEKAFESIQEQIENENGFSQDVIYYSNAIAYLKENDPSLRESLELASEMGFELKNISSEILASLLKSENERTKFYELETEINDFFSEFQLENS